MSNIAICKPVEIKNVKLEDAFWSPYLELVRDTMLPYQWEVLNDREPEAAPSHAVRNFRIAAGLEEGEVYGEVFQDSDLAKWLEAAAYSLENYPDAELEVVIDDVVEIIQLAQQENGYLDTYFTLRNQNEQWMNLYQNHEMYCAGHMMEAAVAYYKATGKRRLLDIMCKNADHIAAYFGKETGKHPGYPGHQEIELALVKLYEATGNEKYLNLSCYFLEERGKEPNYYTLEWESRCQKAPFQTDTATNKPDLQYNQSHQTVDKQMTAVGHAVRAMYMYAAMADVAREREDQKLYNDCRRLWNNVVYRQMYVTGAIGSTPKGEAFTFDYDLPNETAYAETCASIGLIFFAHRMLQMEVDNIYGDVMERALYNVVLGAVSREGRQFFYVNPMEVWPEANEKNPERQHVKPVRQRWFGCACCPPNIARLLTSLEKYIYSYGSNTLYVHLYIGGEIETGTEESKFRVRQECNYPWDGDITFMVLDIPCNESKIAFRIPGWCHEWKLNVNGEPIKSEVNKGYVYVANIKPGDKIKLSLCMEVEMIQANPKVRTDIGKVAIQRGPVVYCLEECDNGANLAAVRLDKKKCAKAAKSWDLPGNAVAVKGNGYRTVEAGWGDCLYRPYSLKETGIEFTAIPYFLWGNRTYGEMQIWTRI